MSSVLRQEMKKELTKARELRNGPSSSPPPSQAIAGCVNTSTVGQARHGCRGEAASSQSSPPHSLLSTIASTCNLDTNRPRLHDISFAVSYCTSDNLLSPRSALSISLHQPFNLHPSKQPQPSHQHGSAQPYARWRRWHGRPWSCSRYCRWRHTSTVTTLTPTWYTSEAMRLTKMNPPHRITPTSSTTQRLSTFRP